MEDLLISLFVEVVASVGDLAKATVGQVYKCSGSTMARER